MRLSFLRWLAIQGLEWLSPMHCALCRLPAASPICGGCVADLPAVGTRCRQCGVVLPDPGICGQCLVLPPSYQSLTCGFDYRFPLDAVLARFKYEADLSLLPAMLQLVSGVAARLQSARGLLLPIPLHPRRERSRGFNQSLLMARSLTAQCELELAPTMLARRRNTPPQAELPFDERAHNMIDAFEPRADCSGLRIWLFDDVVTTGTTMESASQALLEAGAYSVNAVCLLRTVA